MVIFDHGRYRKGNCKLKEKQNVFMTSIVFAENKKRFKYIFTD